ncbi:MAG: hypothetical protein DWH79_02330 [Planctomycetota bacterium]|nr:MAG: hypothetical protein DWH79_02330 [Planctomycetota bacterium]
MTATNRIIAWDGEDAAPEIPGGNPDEWCRRGAGCITTEGSIVKPVCWNTLIQGLVLIRLGQELGSQSQFARAIHDLVAAVLTLGI